MPRNRIKCLSIARLLAAMGLNLSPGLPKRSSRRGCSSQVLIKHVKSIVCFAVLPLACVLVRGKCASAGSFVVSNQTLKKTVPRASYTCSFSSEKRKVQKKPFSVVQLVGGTT